MSLFDKIDVAIDWSEKDTPKVIIQDAKLICSSIDDARFVMDLFEQMKSHIRHMERDSKDAIASLERAAIALERVSGVLGRK